MERFFVKRYQEICKDHFFKKCHAEYFLAGDETGKNFSINCLINQFICNVLLRYYQFCLCPSWQHKSELVDFFNWCRFRRDISIYLDNFERLKK